MTYDVSMFQSKLSNLKKKSTSQRLHTEHLLVLLYQDPTLSVWRDLNPNSHHYLHKCNHEHYVCTIERVSTDIASSYWYPKFMILMMLVHFLYSKSNVWKGIPIWQMCSMQQRHLVFRSNFHHAVLIR